MIPEDLKYTKEHEWVKVDGDTALIGITDYAQSELGYIVFVEMPNVGDKFSQNDTVGTIEAVKTVADIYSPIDGTIIEINQDIESDPEFVNSDPYSKGWLIKMKFSDSSDFKNLLTIIEYKELIS